jgi:RNA ligase (TIGR02306 family)
VGDLTESEWFVEVVEVTEVTKHPNADSLDLIQFKGARGQMAYVVVDRLGTWTPGDLAVYAAVDSLLPLDDERWAFLRPKDWVSGGVHRLKAARLRGIFSQGILTRLGNNLQMGVLTKVGRDVAEIMGITKYEPPQPAEGTPRSEFSNNSVRSKTNSLLPVYGLPSLKKYPHLFEEGEPLVVTEKIHGSNARFGWVNGRWTWGSHRVLHQEKTWWGKLWATVTGRKPKAGWYKEDIWREADRVYSLRRKMQLAPGLALYGEVYGTTASGSKIQDLTYGDAKGVRFAAFDLLDIKTGEFLPYWDFVTICADLDIPVVPLLAHGENAGLGLGHDMSVIRLLAEGKSTVPGATGQIREGAVVRATRGKTRRVAKYVGEGYLTRKGG